MNKLSGKMNNTGDNNLERIISLMQSDRSTDAPADSLKWSKNIFRTRSMASKPSLIERVTAVLKIDLAPGRAAFGERSAGASKARQMLFEAGDNSIDLRLAETESGFEIKGQVLGEGFANCSVSFGPASSEANELGEFALSDIPAGTYDLLLSASGREILIEEIEVS